MAEDERAVHALIHLSLSFRRVIARYLMDEFGLKGLPADIFILMTASRALLVRDLVMILGVKASAISAALNDMQERNLVTRRRSPGNRRTVSIELTQFASFAAQQAAELQRHWWGSLTSDIAESDLHVLSRTLAAMSCSGQALR
ncbi:MarR family transcriptional regulator [Dyella marensis]|jgi:DNA-binding MarR family transcriptional regulator|uniref:DNA-binding transcriptional regulator, MarR family n=1 Tax=Dyella marensis TaxID=500610 RepID=A0A1I2JLS5_9GAMM|nr:MULTISPECIES: MarR family transcriptional regulator [Dyella]SFF55199.1 DNA-binding transcriptional regulator, MarR family [Dyella marensis]